MSTEQAKSFADQLRELSDGFRADAKTTTEGYIKELEDASEEITTASHDYAKTMVERANQYTEDIQALYKTVYPET